MTAHHPMLDAALRYADLGYAVFPCVPGEKRPLTQHGLNDATTDPDQIERWWSADRDANVAVRTDRLLVVDVDGSENPWLTDDSRGRDLARAPSSRTPRGGRHFWFRQPAGTTWRCTQGRLAEKVDTRADGGYIVVPPSGVDGRAYRWLDGHELDVGPEHLPEPPAWLHEQVDQAGTKPQPAEAISDRDDFILEGRRNGELTHLAGAMRRVGMTQAEMAVALHQVNADRCKPPLPVTEVGRIAASIARYDPHTLSPEPTEAGGTSGLSLPAPPRPQTVRELIAGHQTLRAPVVSGLLRRGETMNVIASPKVGKSWLVLGLAMCVATGRQWLESFETVAGQVLLIDNELHAETIAHRIPQVAASLGIGISEIAETIHVQNLRGQLRDIYSLRPCLGPIEPGRIAVVVLDAFYRFIPSGTNENDNAAMANIYNHVDALAEALDSSFVLIHHATKGNQSGRSVTDVGAGAGSQSRATDTHLVLRPHAVPGTIVLEAAVRSWPPILPVALRWSYPVWRRASDLDPLQLKPGTPKRSNRAEKADEKPKPPPWTLERFIEAFLTNAPATKSAIRERAADVPELSLRRVNGFIEIGEDKGLIGRVKLPGRGGRFGFVRGQGEATE